MTTGKSNSNYVFLTFSQWDLETITQGQLEGE